jgi:PTS system ascorbate-specific IIA component
MSIGLLLITHDEIGDLLLRTAENILGNRPLATATVNVKNNHSCEQLQLEAMQLLARLDQGDGVLVLTDLFGSTPANIATKLQQEGRVNVVAGVNLPMVLKVFNYATLDLEGLTAKALAGGQESIRPCRPKPPAR